MGTQYPEHPPGLLIHFGMTQAEYDEKLGHYQAWVKRQKKNEKRKKAEKANAGERP